MNKTFFSKRNDFSESHYKLPRSFGLFDIDILKAEWLSLKDNLCEKENATYIEYRCLKFDKDENRFNSDRIKYIALFELKFKGNDILKEKMNMNPGEPLWEVFMTAKKLQCRFFLVVATEGKSPFYFFEYDINTNQKLTYKTLKFNYEIDDKKIINDFWINELKIT
jgi:hypothetical protein